MSQEIEQNISKILKNQNCKKNIESKLTNKNPKAGKLNVNTNRVQLDCMLFQVFKQTLLTDHIYYFPCVFQLFDDSKVSQQERKSCQIPKNGSFIRSIKMDFDLKSYSLIIYDYQYLGGEGSTVLTNYQKVNWNDQTITQVIRKNNTVKGGQILLDSYERNKKETKVPFEYPRIQFLTVKLLEKILTPVQQQPINASKKRVDMSQDQQSKPQQKDEKKQINQQQQINKQ